MSRALVLTAVVLSGLTIATAGLAGNGTPVNTGSANELTVAAYGDTPYSDALIAAQPELIGSINSDPKVDLVIHVGDTHSGSMLCDSAFNDLTLSWFESFKDPLVYTPGDNEWTDCHRLVEGNHDPLVELANVRGKFFPEHGLSLGGRKKQLMYQSDAVPENVIWEQSKVVFVGISLPGSNNDLAAWTAPYNTPAYIAAQAQEVNARTAADLVWLEQAFALAAANGAQGVLIFEQADMWDGPASNRTGYTQPIPAAGGLPATSDSIIGKLTELAQDFGKPVLLIEGDSHNFKVDNPIGAAPNIRRVVVQGGADNPIAWLKVTISPGGSPLFGLENVQP
jgi:Calcineurin-like phosphoesterase